MPTRGPGTRRRHTPEFKQQVIAEVRAMGGGFRDGSHRAVALRYDISPGLVSTWCRGQQLGLAGGRAPTSKAPGPARNKTLALTVAATQRALDKVNGNGHVKVAPAGASGLIREVLLRLRGLGVQIESITVNGDAVDVSYTVKETIEL